MNAPLDGSAVAQDYTVSDPSPAGDRVAALRGASARPSAGASSERAQESVSASSSDAGSEASLESICAAVLFAVDRPVTIDQLRVAVPGCTEGEIEDALRRLTTLLAATGLELREIGGGVQIQTAPSHHVYIERFLVGKRRAKLSRAALESLSAIAYRQPLTRGELEELRGVDCGQVLHTLLERNLITVVGRSPLIGKPLLYGTTEEFLAYFGLSALTDLPSLEEFRALQGDEIWDDPELREALAEHGFEEPGSERAGAVAGEDAGAGDGTGEEPWQGRAGETLSAPND